MRSWGTTVAQVALLAMAASAAHAAKDGPPTALSPAVEAASDEPDSDPWMDRNHRRLHAFLWRSAMRVDQWFGAEEPEKTYEQQTRGSITPVLLWDEFNGLDQKFRFRVKMPLPHLDERYDAFIGTFSRDEFVTERDQASGAIPRQRTGGRVDEDETLLGIAFRGRRDGGRWEADAGLRIRSPLDPFVKGGYRFEKLTSGGVLWAFRETAFWQNSEKFGFTSRIDIERVVDDAWLMRWSGSGTISQRSEGVRGYTALTVFRGLSDNRAVAAQLFSAGEFDAAVPLGEYGIRLAYRQRVLRDWLVLEIRPSLTWPKDQPGQQRSASWGIGVGLEMFFGEDEFLARPATF